MDNGRYPCPHEACHYSFENRKLLLAHMRNDHILSSTILCCKLLGCGKVYTSIRSYEKHISRMHSEFLIMDSSSTPTEQQHVDSIESIENSLAFENEEHTVDMPTEIKLCR